MLEKLIHTSRQYLGLPIDTTDSRIIESHTAQQVDTTLHTVGKNTFNDFLRELVNECQIYFSANSDSIQLDTILSVTNSENEIFYSTVEELMKYLGIKANNPYDITQYLEKNLVVMIFTDK